MNFKHFYLFSTLIFFSDAFFWPNPISSVDIRFFNDADSHMSSTCRDPNILNYGTIDELRKCSVDDFRRFGLSYQHANNVYRNIQGFEPLLVEREPQNEIIFPKSEAYNDFKKSKSFVFTDTKANFPGNVMRENKALDEMTINRFHKNSGLNPATSKKQTPVLQWLPSGFSFKNKDVHNLRQTTTHVPSSTLEENHTTEASTSKKSEPTLEELEEVNYLTTQGVQLEKLNEDDSSTTEGMILEESDQVSNPTTQTTASDSDGPVLKMFPSGFHFINSRKNNTDLKKGFTIQHFDRYQ